MKKLILCAVFALSTTFACASANADTLMLVNHYGHPLNFAFTAGHQYVEGLSSNFTLENKQIIMANAVLKDPQPGECEPTNSYVKIELFGNGSDDGFFGFGRNCGSNNDNGVSIRAYIGRNIAYSIQDNEGQDPVVIFCSPQVFDKYGKCL